MLKLNRTTEYSLMSLTYIRGKGKDQLTSAREIADHFDLPFEILAKTLQRLKEQGVISSTYGTRGGYVLARDLAALSLAEFLKLMEGPTSVVACQHPLADQNCGYRTNCNIHTTMVALNDRFHDFLTRISIEELTRSPFKQAAALAACAGETIAFEGGEP